ncbi:MAG: hypothetical protein ABIB79_01965 [archaeon]
MRKIMTIFFVIMFLGFISAFDGTINITLGKKPVIIESVGGISVPDPGDKINSLYFGVATYSEYDESGFLYTSDDQMDNLNDLGLGIERLTTDQVPIWINVQPTRTSNFNFTKYDDLYKRFTEQTGVKLFLTLRHYTYWDQNQCHPDRVGPMYPCDMNLYLNYLNAVIERYDGDLDYGCSQSAPDCYVVGDRQYPDWTALNQPSIKYWQLANELGNINFWADTPENYSILLNITYQTIKQLCSNCKLAIGGQASGAPTTDYYDIEVFYETMLKNATNPSFDIIDLHMYNKKGYYNLFNNRLSHYKTVLTEEGFNLNDIKFWSTEMATFSGEFWDVVGYQTEEDQASELIKRYIEPFYLGVESIHWGRILERGDECNLFAFHGLIHNPLAPENCTGSPIGYGLNHKKLSYYTYKLLIEKLTNSSVNIEKNSSDNVYVYRFDKSGKPVYVVWWDWFEDIGESKNITLDLIGFPTNQAKITEAVPNSVDGSSLDLIDYPTFFNNYLLNLSTCHPADDNKDGFVSASEIRGYMEEWKQNTIGINEFMDAVKVWRG